MSAQERLSNVIVDILLDLYKSGVRTTDLPHIVKTYIVSEDFRFGNKTQKILPFFIGDKSFFYDEDDEDIEIVDDSGDENVGTINVGTINVGTINVGTNNRNHVNGTPIFTPKQFQDIMIEDTLKNFAKIHVDSVDAVEFAQNRIKDVNDMIYKFGEIFKSEMDRNLDHLEGFEYNEKSNIFEIQIPRNITPASVARISLGQLTHYTIWDRKRQEINRRTTETKDKRKKEKLDNIKNNEVKTLEEISDLLPSEYINYKDKARNTSWATIDSMLLKIHGAKKGAKDALYIYPIKLQLEKETKKKSQQLKNKVSRIRKVGKM